MTEPQWRNWTPQYDGHAPDDWDDGMEWEWQISKRAPWRNANEPCQWLESLFYRYRPLQEATNEPDLLAQCLALPQADRDALIKALQKPQRDWADDVWEKAFDVWRCTNSEDKGKDDAAAAAVIRSMCRPKEEKLLGDIFDFLGGVDGASELRGKLLKIIKS